METIRDLLAELLDLNGSKFRVRYEGYPLRRLEDLDEEAWVSLITGIGAIRQRAMEAEARAIELWSKRRLDAGDWEAGAAGTR